ncbi:hypothetical protein LLG95_14640, partial [bacterium]|nr:hypothetical protein [bacterium]
IPPAPVRQPSIREIAELPAMPLARIADELNRITTALSQDLIAVPFSSSIGPIQSISPISPNPEPALPSADHGQSARAAGSTQSATPPPIQPATSATNDPGPRARDIAPIAQPSGP